MEESAGDDGNSAEGGGISAEGGGNLVDFGVESMIAFVKRFRRELPQEIEMDCYTNRYDGSFFKVC